MLICFLISIIFNITIGIYIIKKSIESNISFIKIVKILLYNGSQLVLCYMLYGFTNRIDTAFVDVMCLFGFLISSLSFIPIKMIFDKMLDKLNIDEEYEFLVRKEEMDKNYFSLMNKYENQLSIIRHDFVNQIEVAESLIENERDNKVAKEMLDEIRNELDSTKLKLFTNSKILNMVISIMENQYRDNEFELEANAFVSISRKIDDIDLCLIVENLLNEMLMIMQLKGEMERKIKFLIKNSENQLVMKVLATKNIEDSREYVKITKSHTKYLNKIIEKYNGNIYEREEEGKVELMLTLANS